MMIFRSRRRAGSYLLATASRRLTTLTTLMMLNIIVVRHNIPILEGGSLASYIDTQNAFPSVHSAAPQLPLT
jgi:hypothetical protein